MELLNTQRIKLRKFTKQDFDNLYCLDSDPLVMKYISNGVPFDAERVQEILNLIILRYDEWKNFGLWAAELKDSDEFIGWFALKPLPKTNEIEVGYRLLPKFWGKGFATEGTKGLIAYGFNECNLDKIVAITNPANTASQKVLLKCGFKKNGSIPNPFSKEEMPEEVFYFEMKKPN